VPLKKKEDSMKLSLPPKLMVLRVSLVPLNANVLFCRFFGIFTPRMAKLSVPVLLFSLLFRITLNAAPKAKSGVFTFVKLDSKEPLIGAFKK
jgi:hypothetical protein